MASVVTEDGRILVSGPELHKKVRRQYLICRHQWYGIINHRIVESTVESPIGGPYNVADVQQK